MTGMPATMAMHFRNGSVAFSYLTTLLMKFVDEHKISLKEKVARWLLTLPEANQVTVKTLANMTSGYPDYVTDPSSSPSSTRTPFTSSQMLNSWPSPSPSRYFSGRERTGATRTPTW